MNVFSREFRDRPEENLCNGRPFFVLGFEPSFFFLTCILSITATLNHSVCKIAHTI